MLLIGSFGEAEAGDAGEQPARNSRIQNEWGAIVNCTPFLILILAMPNKTQKLTQLPDLRDRGFIFGVTYPLADGSKQ